MTSTQAIREAIRRWTLARAFACSDPCVPAEERFQVGYTDGCRDIILGFGAAWEEAFRLACEPPSMTLKNIGGGPTLMACSKNTLVGAAWRRGLHLHLDPAGCVDGNVAMLGHVLGLITSSNFMPQVNVEIDIHKPKTRVRSIGRRI
jgi:hypothetical protein